MSSVPAEQPVLRLPGVEEGGQAGGAGGPQQQLDGVVVARQVHQQPQGLEGHRLVLPGWSIYRQGPCHRVQRVLGCNTWRAIDAGVWAVLGSSGGASQ